MTPQPGTQTKLSFSARRKKAAGSRPSQELCSKRWCQRLGYLGVVAGGVAGFGAVAAGLAAGAGGAGTPDSLLYASITARVISTFCGEDQITWPSGHCLVVSINTPKPLSAAYFTMMGAILERMREAISFCWAWYSSVASCRVRSKLFCLDSICFTTVSRAVGVAAELAWPFRVSSSLLKLVSSVCRGSNFLSKAAKSR